MLSQTLVANLSLTSSVLGPSNLRIKKFWMAWSGERERAEILPRGADPLSANTALAATSSFYSSLLPLQLHLCYLYSAILQLYFSSLLRPLPLAPSSLSPSLDGSLSPALFPRSSFSFAMLSLSTDTHHSWLFLHADDNHWLYSLQLLLFYEHQLWSFNSFCIFLHENPIVASNWTDLK